MSNLLLLLTILSIHALAVISPGPDFVVAVKNSMMYGRNSGMWTAVGFGLGIAVHVTYCALGLAVIISQSIVLFTIIKRLGALYLIWIGGQALLSTGSSAITFEYQEQHLHISRWQAIKQGFLTNVLNPKATLFFLGLFTMIITPTIPVRVVIIACVMMVVNTTLWFCLVSVFFTNSAIRKRVNKRQHAISKVLGGALIALGITIGVSE